MQWANGQEKVSGLEYGLPTEAQWEHAARGPGENRYAVRYWGDGFENTEGCKYGNVATGDHWTHAFDCLEVGDYVYTAPVKMEGFRANGFGLHQMLGNAWEWTCSAYGKTYDEESIDVRNNDTTDAALRLMCGGSWLDDFISLRAAHREKYEPYASSFNISFRLVLLPKD